MEILETAVRTYEEWKEENRKDILEKIIEKNRDINIQHSDWYYPTIEDFCTRVEEKGFNVEAGDVRFTGFWCQGDGASFTGSIDILTFLRKTKQLTKYRSVVAKINNNIISDTVTIDQISYQYCHENTCSVEDIEVYDEDLITPKVQDLLDELYALLEETRYDLCKELYSELQSDYDSLTSDEYIIETILLCRYSFNEEGDLSA